MHSTAPNTCANCLAPIAADYHFCPNCGQQTHVHRFDMPHIVHEVFHAFTHADKGVLHLIKSLAIRPGVAAREYILEGKRKKYFNPFTFLLLVLGFTVFVYSFYEPYGSSRQPNRPASAQSAAPTDSGVAHRRQVVGTLLNKRANLIAFIALPIFALIYWLFFRRTGLRYAEHLVALIFFNGFFQLVAGMLALGFGLFNRPATFLSELQLGFQFIYLPIAYYQFLGYHKPIRFLLTLLASVLALGCWVLLSSQVIRYYVVHGF